MASDQLQKRRLLVSDSRHVFGAGRFPRTDVALYKDCSTELLPQMLPVGNPDVRALCTLHHVEHKPRAEWAHDERKRDLCHGT